MDVHPYVLTRRILLEQLTRDAAAAAGKIENRLVRRLLQERKNKPTGRVIERSRVFGTDQLPRGAVWESSVCLTGNSIHSSFSSFNRSNRLPSRFHATLYASQPGAIFSNSYQGGSWPYSSPAHRPTRDSQITGDSACPDSSEIGPVVFVEMPRTSCPNRKFESAIAVVVNRCGLQRSSVE